MLTQFKVVARNGGLPLTWLGGVQIELWMGAGALGGCIWRAIRQGGALRSVQVTRQLLGPRSQSGGSSNTAAAAAAAVQHHALGGGRLQYPCTCCA